MRTILAVCAAAAAIGSCALDDEQAQVDSVGLEVTSVAGDAAAQDVAREAMLLYEELAARLEERGYTPAELLAAGEAGDEPAVREMLGYTDAEFASMHARLMAIAAAAEDMPADASHPDGWTCKPEVIPCITSLGLAYLVRGGAVSVPALLAYGGIHVAGCVYTYCSFDRTDPGPPVKRP